MSPQTMPSETDFRANRVEDAEADARLRNDIRLLGRILGDTVRDQEGAECSTWSSISGRPRPVPPR